MSVRVRVRSGESLSHAEPGAGPLAEPVNRGEWSQVSRPGVREQVVIPYEYYIYIYICNRCLIIKKLNLISVNLRVLLLLLLLSF